MDSNPKFSPELIAPCGMNCALCKSYNAYIHEVPQKRGKVSHCAGCLPRAKNCYVKRGCEQMRKNQIQSCTECKATMPCKNLARLDKRYRERYGMSMVANINEIKAKGMAEFLKNQAIQHRCPKCDGVVCVHDRKCYSCGYEE